MTPIKDCDAENVFVWLGGLGIRRTTIMIHCARLLTATLHADEYLAIQLKGTVSWLNLLEPQLSIAEIAARRGRRLNEGAHIISFRPTRFGARKRDAQKDPG